MSHVAIAYLQSQDYAAGAECCERAIAAQPADPLNYWYLGLFRLLQGDPAEAQAVWFAAIANLDPTQLEAATHPLLTILITEATHQLELGHANVAEQIDYCILDLDANQLDIYLQLGHAVCLQGRPEEALDHWQTVIQLQPDLIAAYLSQAEVWCKFAQWQPAIAAYEHVLSLDPHAPVHAHLGNCYAHLGDWSAAIAHFTQAIAQEPTASSLYSDRGWAHLQLGHETAATADFHTALHTLTPYAHTYAHWVETLRQHQFPCPAGLEHNAHCLHTLTFPPSVPAAAPAPLPPHPTPPRYLPDLPSWAATQPDGVYVPLDPPDRLLLVPPRKRPLHFSFRLAPEIPLPPTFVLTLPHGRYWLNADQSSSAVFTKSGELIGDLSPEFPLLTPNHPDKQPQFHSLWQQPPLPPPQAIAGRVAVLAGLTNGMYFHWLFDVLPRVDLLMRSGVTLDSIDYFVISADHPFQQETLALLNIPPEKILPITPDLHITADQLVVPSYPCSPAWMTRRVCDWLRSLILDPTQGSSQPRDRLYITRQQTSSRRVINEADVIEFLAPLGFQTIALEDYSVREQAHLLANAAIVISAHGGGLTNLVFCQPGTRVIELFPPDFVYPCYWVLSNVVNLNYDYLVNPSPAGSFLQQYLYPNPRLADIWVDVSSLATLLAHLE